MTCGKPHGCWGSAGLVRQDAVECSVQTISGDRTPRLSDFTENGFVGLGIAAAKAAGTTAVNFLNFIGGGIAGDSDLAAAGWNGLVHTDRDATVATVMMLAPGGLKSMKSGIAAEATESSFTGICFVAGTLVHTSSGVKRIEDVQLDDVVFAINTTTRSLEKKRVVRLFRNASKPVLAVSISKPEGGVEILGVSPEHPFWINGQGWVASNLLKAGDVLQSLNGLEQRVVSVVDRGEHADTFNFEVEEDHNYFVGIDGVLVHNQSKLGANLGKDFKFPNEKQLAQELNTSVKTFHSDVKAGIKSDFAKEMKAINSTNPDIGVSSQGMLVLKNPQTGKTIDTGVPLKNYAQ